MKFNKLLLISLILGACLQAVGSDIYAPSLTSISSSLHTTFSLAKWSMAIYLLAVAVSQLFYGPLSEGIGRKMPLVGGIAIMIVGSFVCVFATNIQTLLVGRCIQGLGVGACAALWRSVLRDMFTGDQLSKIGSYLGIFIIAVVSTAPALGGYLEHYFSWRASFVFLVIYSVVTLVFIMRYFHETSQHHHAEHLKAAYIFGTFKQLITHPQFLILTFCSFLAYGGLFSWTTAGPILLMHGTHLSAVEFGWMLALGGGVAYLSAMKINSTYVERWGCDFMIGLGALFMFGAGLIMLFLSLTVGLVSWAVYIPAIVFTFGVSFIFPNIFAKAFTPFGKIAGYAGALYGCLQIAGGGVLASIIAHVPDHNAVPLAVIFMVVALLIGVLYSYVKRHSVIE